jgi:hypothetical protein
VPFKPSKPVALNGAVVIKDGTGNVLATTYIYGKCVGPQVALLPSTITKVAGNGTWSNSGDNGSATSAQPQQGVASSSAAWSWRRSAPHEVFQAEIFEDAGTRARSGQR